MRLTSGTFAKRVAGAMNVASARQGTDDSDLKGVVGRRANPNMASPKKERPAQGRQGRRVGVRSSDSGDIREERESGEGERSRAD